ncbi:MAG: DUF4834 domain-containing protein [Mucilaginibacter sp.]
MILIRILLVSIAVLYIIRTLARIFLPMLFQSMIKKAQQQQNTNYQQTRKPEGAVRVDYTPQYKSQVPDTEGDFVEYEEIKEK